MARAHLFRPVTDEAGNLLYGATITVRRADLGGLIGQPIYNGPLESAEEVGNPYVTHGGYVDIWLNKPDRVNLFIESSGREPISVTLDVNPPPVEVLRTAYPLSITNQAYEGAVLLGESPTQATWGDPPVVPPSGTVAAHSHDGTGGNSTAVGTDAVASGDNATAVGDGSQATALSSTAYGSHAQATAPSATSFGADSSATGSQGTAVGSGASAGSSGTAVGAASNASGGRSAAIGRGSYAGGEGAVAVGVDAYAQGTEAVALGDSANASSERAVALGKNANATHARAVALGQGAQTQADDEVVLGGPSSTLAVLGTLWVGQGVVLGGATGTLGFFGATPVAKRQVVGAVTSPALAAALVILDDLGLIDNATTGP